MTAKNPPKPKLKLSLSKVIFLAMGLGLLTGLFFGEMVGFLEIVGDIWIKLLQMTVLPYVMLSLIAGLGRLNYDEALHLAKKGGVMLLLLWVAVLLVVFMFPLSFPDWVSSSFYSAAIHEAKADVDFLGLYIPSNPFHALANDLVPAVVLFSIALGMALIGIERKDTLLDGISLVIDALTRIANFIVKLTPLGVFSIMASASGTMSFIEFQRLEVYIVSYIALSTVMALWILPGLVTILTPLSYRDVVGSTKDALVMAFATTSLFIVLPILMEKSKELIGRYAEDQREAASSVEIIVPVSFNFPHAGKLFTLSFVLFAGWYSGYPVAISDYPQLVSAGLASLFANVNLAIPFLLDTLRIPQDTYQIFITTGIVNARFATLLAAVFTLTLTLLAAFSMSGLIRFNWLRTVRYLVISFLLLALSIVGVRVFFTTLMHDTYDKDELILGMHFMQQHVPSKVFTGQPPVREVPKEGTRLESLAESGTLKICYASDDVPFSYFNDEGNLVGLDVELFHYLAADLGVKLTFVPSDWVSIVEQLNSGYCDMGTGRTMTPGTALTGAYTIPIMNRIQAFLVPDHRRSEFSSFESIRELGNIRLAIAPSRHYGTLVAKRLHDAEIVEVPSLEPYLEKELGEFDALVTTGEKAAAWALEYPEYTAVMPGQESIKVPAGFPLPHNEESLADYMKVWLTVRQQDGTIQRLRDYWVLGKQLERKQHRWSVIRDVLHWVE